MGCYLIPVRGCHTYLDFHVTREAAEACRTYMKYQVRSLVLRIPCHITLEIFRSFASFHLLMFFISQRGRNVDCFSLTWKTGSARRRPYFLSGSFVGLTPPHTQLRRPRVKSFLFIFACDALQLKSYFLYGDKSCQCTKPPPSISL